MCDMSRVIRVTAIALVMSTFTALPAAALTERINAWVKSGGRTVGVGIVSNVSDSQVLRRRVSVGSTVRFTIIGKHRGSSNGSVEILGCGGSPDFVVHYRLPSGTDVTTEVTGSGYTFRHVGDGDRVRLTQVWRVRPSAKGSLGSCGVLVRTRDRSDVVMPQVKAI
jgi:hypothetical protein